MTPADTPDIVERQIAAMEAAYAAFRADLDPEPGVREWLCRQSFAAGYRCRPSAPQARDEGGAVDFYEREFYPLSNFSAFTLEWKGRHFDTSEAVYHWEKFGGNASEAPHQTAVQDQIRNAPSAHEAFKIAEINKPLRRPDWDSVKVHVMREIIRAKADQHEYVRRKLLETGDRPLIEGSWRDDFWGIGPNGDGQNMLGKLWMELRAELAPSPPTDAINTAEGEAWLAQRGETATGLMRREPTEPAGRLLGTDQSDVNADEGAGAAGEPPHLDAPWGLASAVASPPQTPHVARIEAVARAIHTARGDGYPWFHVDFAQCRHSRELARAALAALTPRELTPEEAERGARASNTYLAGSPAEEFGWEVMSKSAQAHRIKAARALYRAITEEPAR